MEPRVFIRDLSSMMEEDAILVADVGQNQIWCARNFNVKEGRFLTSGGLGTMGYSIPAAMGAKIAKPHRQVVAVCGDGSFQMSMCELGTICQHKVPVKIIVMENGRLGMVREVQDRLYEGRHMATILDGDPDFVALAKAYGIRSARAESNAGGPPFGGRDVGMPRALYFGMPGRSRNTHHLTERRLDDEIYAFCSCGKPARRPF